MLDANLKLWLIEINSSPSLSASSLEDYELKFGLLWDTFDVIDLENNRAKKEFRVGGYDLIWNEDDSFFKDNLAYPLEKSSSTTNYKDENDLIAKDADHPGSHLTSTHPSHQNNSSGPKKSKSNDRDSKEAKVSSYNSHAHASKNINSHYVNSPKSRSNRDLDEVNQLLANHSVHLDPLVHSSFIFKNLPSYPTNCYVGCPYNRQSIVLEDS